MFFLMTDINVSVFRSVANSSQLVPKAKRSAAVSRCSSYNGITSFALSLALLYHKGILRQSGWTTESLDLVPNMRSFVVLGFLFALSQGIATQGVRCFSSPSLVYCRIVDKMR